MGYGNVGEKIRADDFLSTLLEMQLELIMPRIHATAERSMGEAGPKGRERAAQREAIDDAIGIGIVTSPCRSFHGGHRRIEDMQRTQKLSLSTSLILGILSCLTLSQAAAEQWKQIDQNAKKDTLWVDMVHPKQHQSKIP